MLCSPSSFTMTATRFMSGRLRSRLMSVVLPLPRKPVTMLTGMRPASGSRACAEGSVRRSMLLYGKDQTHPHPHLAPEGEGEFVKSPLAFRGKEGVVGP